MCVLQERDGFPRDFPYGASNQSTDSFWIWHWGLDQKGTEHAGGLADGDSLLPIVGAPHLPTNLYRWLFPKHRRPIMLALLKTGHSAVHLSYLRL